MTDLDRLKGKHPLWAIGSVWATAGSGPDRRKLWATRGSITVHAWSAEALSEQIAIEERHNDWSTPECR